MIRHYHKYAALIGGGQGVTGRGKATLGESWHGRHGRAGVTPRSHAFGERS